MAENMDASELAQQRANVILDVRSGKITATDGANLLGLSRQSYYKWDERAFCGMVEALMDRDAGRPSNPTPDTEKEEMRKELKQLQRENEKLRQALSIRTVLQEENIRPVTQPDPLKKSVK